jgi:hypothetical protein
VGQRDERSSRKDLTPVEAYALAADVELQYRVHGPRDQANVRRVSPPVPVDAWQERVGELDAWVNEDGRWLGRVRLPDGRVAWIDESDVRPTADGNQVAPGSQRRAV